MYFFKTKRKALITSPFISHLKISAYLQLILSTLSKEQIITSRELEITMFHCPLQKQPLSVQSILMTFSTISQDKLIVFQEFILIGQYRQYPIQLPSELILKVAQLVIVIGCTFMQKLNRTHIIAYTLTSVCHFQIYLPIKCFMTFLQIYLKWITLT